MWDLLPVLPRNMGSHSNYYISPFLSLENKNTTFVDPTQQHQHSARILQEAGQRGVIYDNFVSPPTPYALSLTPKGYRSDFAIDFGQTLSSLGLCDDHHAGEEEEHVEACQILFHPPSRSGDVHYNYNSPESYSSSSSSSSSSDDKQFDRRQDETYPHHYANKVGVLFYGGALVDPRSYSPIAHQLSVRYGIPTSIPIFMDNLAFGFACDTSRIEMASRAFPHVEKWVLVGHSLGGLAAMGELYHLMVEDKDREGEGQQEQVVENVDSIGIEKVGGLVLLASYLNQDVGCGPVDFSNNVHGLAFASIDSDLDGVLNRDLWEAGQSLLPKNETFS
jgi:hypothetical protein